MKHLLNNISEEEKNRIREQHEGGMNLSIDNFKKLVETKLGDAKPFINEASEETCEQCGAEMREGECVEQCGSMKEEVNEQNEDDVIRLIMDINTKLPDDLKSRMVIMKDFDDNQKVSFFERLMALAEKHFEKELNEEINEQSSGVNFDDYAIEKLEGCGFEKVDDGKYIFKDKQNGDRVTYTVVAEKFANSNYIGHSLYDQDGNKYYSLPSDACWVEFDKLIGCK